MRANNIAYGEKACKYIGDHVPEGPVVQIMGDQASINGRDRGNGFRDCITKNYPKLKLLEIPTKAWSGEDAAAGLDADPQLDARTSRRSTCTPAASSWRRRCRR